MEPKILGSIHSSIFMYLFKYVFINEKEKKGKNEIGSVA